MTPYFLPQVADMLLELCVTELEDVATDSQSGRLSSQPVVVESSHPYTDDTSSSGTVKIPGTHGHPWGLGSQQTVKMPGVQARKSATAVPVPSLPFN